MAGYRRAVAWAFLPAAFVLIGSIALAGDGGERSSEEQPDPEADSNVGLAIEGFHACELGSAGCVPVWVSMDFYAGVTGDKTVKYPKDYGLPECQEPSHDPGFEPGEVPDEEELESAPECAVHPRMAIAVSGFTADSAEELFTRFGCGGSEKQACQREDIDR